ncbi:MAG: branched-chain amino acid ABC transporter permease [Chloroflexota bacterium]|nr:branched-chain amino acid ABC transporter permease [Chloroflexota bacterium]MDE3194460.1 branched-chain amino acid ABC transporter permease [Chloroflexota bacterium]
MNGDLPAVLAFGVVDAAVLAVAAVGFTLQFGVTNYFNFGYSEWLTFGAFMAYVLNVEPLHLNIWIAMPIAGVATAALSYVINRAVFLPFVKRRSETLYILIVTLAVGLLLNNAYIVIWGTAYHEYAQAPRDMHHLGPVTVGTDQIAFLAIALALMLATHAVLAYTRLGRSMRAIADDRQLATVCGLDPERLADATWIMTGAMAGIAGVILAMQVHTFGTDIGANYTYLIFPAVIIGGIGRAYGAMLGATIIGVLTTLGVLIIPAALSPSLIFAAIVVMVLFRPQGLLGGLSHGHMQEA